MIQYLLKRISLKFIDQYFYGLHLSVVTVILLAVGIWLLYKLFTKTAEIGHTLIGFGLLLMLASYVNSHFVPLAYQQSLLMFGSVFPIAIGLILGGIVLLLLRSTARFTKHLIVGLLISSLFSSGFLFSTIAPQVVNNLPLVGGLFASGAKALNSFGAGQSVTNIAAQTGKQYQLFTNGNTVSTSSIVNKGSADYGKISDEKPTDWLSKSILTQSVASQLGSNLTYNSAGDYYTVNGNKPDVPSPKGKPYAQNIPLNTATHQVGYGLALLNNTTYQGQNRATTGNGSSSWRPYGYQEQKLPGSHYQWLFNLGHTLGYALIGNVSGFDSSEHTQNNISTQTSWANQADGGVQGDGQNYWEGQVRKEIESSSVLVSYKVTPIYNAPTDLVPMGSQIEALSADGKISFDVFVPNVQPGVSIDYSTGKGTVK